MDLLVRRQSCSDGRAERTPGARRRRDDRGASALEFAIVLPVLLLFLFGIIEFGSIFLIKHGLTETAADATRGAATVAQANASTVAMTDVTNDIHGDAGLLSSSDLCNDASGAITCTATVAQCPNQPTGYNCLTVNLTYSYGSDKHAVLPDLLGLAPKVTASSTVLLTGNLSS